jgi:hypothetical protein
MSTGIAINRPAETLPGAAPVAMQRGRRGDRIALAQLRVKRRWLLRRRHKAQLVAGSHVPAPMLQTGPTPNFGRRTTR